VVPGESARGEKEKRAKTEKHANETKDNGFLRKPKRNWDWGKRGFPLSKRRVSTRGRVLRHALQGIQMMSLQQKGGGKNPPRNETTIFRPKKKGVPGERKGGRRGPIMQGESRSMKTNGV